MKALVYIGLILICLSCSKVDENLIDGFWTFYAFQNKDSGQVELDSTRHQLIVLNFKEDGEVTVNNIVNTCSGSYKVSNGIKFNEMACTEMASEDSLDNVLETRFIEALTQSQTFHIIDGELRIQFNNESDAMNELVFSKNNCAC